MRDGVRLMIIRISTDHGARDVEGELIAGPWAVTPIIDAPDEWTVTHVPTGAGCASRIRGPRGAVWSLAAQIAHRFPTFDPSTDVPALADFLRGL
jgi:hypothetical protein